MDANKIRKLIELIEELVAGNDPWKEKHAAILAEASENEKSAIEEFASWFEV